MGKAAEPRWPWKPATTTIFLLIPPLIYAIIFFSDTSLVDLWKQVPYNFGECSCKGRAGGEISNGSGEKDEPLTSLLGELLRGNDRRELETTGFGCKSDHMNDVCVTNQHVWMKSDAGALTVYLSSSSSDNNQTLLPPQFRQNSSRMLRPYVKKDDDHVRRCVREITINMPIQQQSYNHTTNVTTPTTCDVTHDVPAVVFSSGLIGNVFHELNEIILPLFLTSHHFRSRVRLVITDFNHKWVHKFRQVLFHISDYEIINASEDKRVHCFPGAVIGLHFHNENLVCSNSDLPVNCSMLEFTQFLREAFHLKNNNVSQLISSQDQNAKPVLVLLSRRHSRMILNEGEVVTMASELGFEVVVATPELTSNMDEFSIVVNNCSVLVGAHGAGFTNEVFMPEGAVVVQVVPIGVQWASDHYYGTPLKEMHVQYLEYQISPEESTLSDKYGPNSTIVTDPGSIHRQGFNVGRPIYIDGQDIRLNITTFRDTLVQALKLLGR